MLRRLCLLLASCSSLAAAAVKLAAGNLAEANEALATCCKADSKVQTVTVKSNNLTSATTSEPRSIVFTGVHCGSGQGNFPAVDLVVREATPGMYKAGSPSQNGMHGDVMQISVAAGTSVDFDLLLLDAASRQRITAKQLLLYVYDLTRGREDTELSGVQAVGFNEFYRSPKSELSKMQTQDLNYWFVSGKPDGGEAAPRDPDDISDVQRDRMITFLYLDVDKVSVTFKVGPGHTDHAFAFYVRACLSCGLGRDQELQLIHEASLLLKAYLSSTKTSYTALFESVDANGSNELSRTEFAQLFATCHGHYTEEQLDVLYKEVSKKDTEQVTELRVASVFSISYTTTEVITTETTETETTETRTAAATKSHSSVEASAAAATASSSSSSGGGGSSSSSGQLAIYGYDADIGSSLLSICDPGKYGQTLEVKQNNLGGKGPVPSPHRDMRYTGLSVGCAKKGLDLIVTEKTHGEYQTSHPSKNGVSGQLMRINVAAGTSVDLSLALHDSDTGEPVAVRELLLYFYNLNEGLDGKSRSGVSPLGFKNFYTTTSSQLVKTKDAANDRWWFISSRYTPGVEAPTDWANVTPQQKDQMVELRYTNVQNVNVQFKVTPGGEGHDFVFFVLTCIECAEESTTTLPAATLPTTTLSLEYDCDAAFANWRDAWSPQKKVWCCKHAGRGCASGSGYDCNAAFANWRDAWSVGKKQWCCEHSGVGCEGTTTKEVYDCDAAFANWRDAWSESKKTWCCREAGKGCPGSTTLPPYDCDAGFATWEYSWSPNKKLWCCEHGGRGCTTTSVATSIPYDCDAGFAEWERSWTLGKRRWCCKNSGRACEGTYDCDEGYSTWQVMWSQAKMSWCCKSQGRGCTSTSTVLRYDCEAGFATWDTSWSRDKKVWCCKHAGKGCHVTTTTLTTTDVHYDCFADFTPCDECLAKRWSVSKRRWCCFHESRGCETTTTPITFDCSAGYANWVRGWSLEKKAWCCKHEFRACQTTSAEPWACDGDSDTWPEEQANYCCRYHGRGCAPVLPTTQPPALALYDCVAGYSNWVQGWSESKKAWCCAHAGHGCPQPETTRLPYDCAADYHDCFECLEKSWSVGKLKWCCEHEHVACRPERPRPPLPQQRTFDCYAGYANWENGWSIAKKEWCCLHQGMGCAHGHSLSMYQQKFDEGQGQQARAAPWFPAPALATSCLAMAFLAGVTSAWVALGGLRRPGPAAGAAYTALPTVDASDREDC